MASYQDLCRHHIKYNKTLNGPTGALADLHQSAASASGYGTDNGDGWTYPFPKIVGYECAWSTAIPAGVSTQLAVVRAGLSHDFMFHPSFYDTSTAFLEHMQQPGPTGTPGFDTICIESLNGLPNSGPGVATTADSSSTDGHFDRTLVQLCLAGPADRSSTVYGPEILVVGPGRRRRSA